MDRVLGIILTGTVLVMTALILTTMASTSLGGFMDAGEKQKSSRCEFQYKNAETPSQISQSCNNKKIDSQIVRRELADRVREELSKK